MSDIQTDLEYGSMVLPADIARGQGEQEADTLVRTWRQRSKVSPTIWRLALLGGDGLCLVGLLVAVLPMLRELQLHALSGRSALYGYAVAGSPPGLWNTNFFWIYVLLASWSVAAHITQAQDVNCASSLLKSPLSALCALALGLIFCIVLLSVLIGGEVISYTKALLLFVALAAPGLCTWRVMLAACMKLPRFRRQAVIVGVTAAGREVAQELLSARHAGSTVLGYICGSGGSVEGVGGAGRAGYPQGSSVGRNKYSKEGVGGAGRAGYPQGVPLPWTGCIQEDGLPVLGDSDVLRGLARAEMIDMMIMAIDYKDNAELFEVALEGAQHGITVLPVTEVYERTSGKIPVEHICGQWYTALPGQDVGRPLYACWRKAMDLVFGMCGVVMLGLLLPIVALLIFLDSPGPIFYSQERTGFRGRSFRILKFRSMCTNAEHAEGGALGGGWTSKGDVRVTRVGRLLRATHLDELPQVLNIVRGEMSLIGPRPERPDYVSELEKQDPFYCYRLSTRPGLTGWAQVKYGYGSGEQDELVKLQYDLYYIKHRSFLLDVLIILKTIVEVVYCHGI